MNSAERVMCVLRCEEPDRLPHFEWIIDEKVRHAICPGSSTEEFSVRMGLDAILTAPDYSSTQVGPNRLQNEWGMVVEKGEEQHSTVVGAVIETLEDFAAYSPPDPGAATIAASFSGNGYFIIRQIPQRSSRSSSSQPGV